MKCSFSSSSDNSELRKKNATNGSYSSQITVLYFSCPAFQLLQFIWINCVRFLGKSVGKISEGVNLTQKIHPVEAFEPGAEHVVRLLTKSWVANNSIFEDVIETRGTGEK